MVSLCQSFAVKKYAGNGWLRGLRKWHKFLCLRKSEATSLTWYTSFNQGMIFLELKLIYVDIKSLLVKSVI
jgi:hypothetical protein